MKCVFIIFEIGFTFRSLEVKHVMDVVDSREKAKSIIKGYNSLDPSAKFKIESHFLRQ